MSVLDRIAERQLVVVTGKGGVGKTTLAAVLGRLLADRGRRVLLLEVDPGRVSTRPWAPSPPGGRSCRRALVCPSRTSNPAQ